MSAYFRVTGHGTRKTLNNMKPFNRILKAIQKNKEKINVRNIANLKL